MLFFPPEGCSEKSEERKEEGALVWWKNLQGLKIPGERGIVSSASGMRNQNNQTLKPHTVLLGQALKLDCRPSGLLCFGQPDTLKETKFEYV